MDMKEAAGQLSSQSVILSQEIKILFPAVGDLTCE